MFLLVVSVSILFLFGILALLLGSSPRWSARAGLVGSVAGCSLAALPALRAVGSSGEMGLRCLWQVPGGEFHIGLDALSGFFILPIVFLSGLGAIYGREYLCAHQGHHRLGPAWFFYNVLIASMILVVASRNAVLFLVAWETMALSSFFLVTFDDDKPHVREAGWTYLVATHLGTAFLFGMFAILQQEAGSLDFDDFQAVQAWAPATASLIFIFAIIGFGTKAGIVPFHVWLPQAHPAAPSHVSAVMSGVMIKTGIYGLVRVMMFLDAPALWWSWLLMGLGVLCAVYGVLFALVQHDIKRLLAYHSVENIGIILLGLGVGLWGECQGYPHVAVLGYAGGLLHVLNHALFKGLLFLGAGNVIHATGSGDLDGLGGLFKRMPRTGLCFLIGAAAICGLPPLNGFVSEFLIFLASMQGYAMHGSRATIPLLGTMVGLALISGLAAACFSKVFGMVFLGEPRGAAAMGAREVAGAMWIPLAVLGGGCLLIGLLAPFCLSVMTNLVGQVTGLPENTVSEAVVQSRPGLSGVMLGAMFFFVLFGGLAWFRRRLLSGRAVEETVTWDCGYAEPTPRMQYTASSYAQPLADLFRMLLRTRRHYGSPDGYFPAPVSLHTETPDVCHDLFYHPLFTWVCRGAARIRQMQHGNVQIYVLYIAITLLVLLVWKVG